MSHRSDANASNDWSNYLSSISVEIQNKVGANLNNVAEQTQSLIQRADVNTKIRTAQIWVENQISAPDEADRTSKQLLLDQKKQLERLLQVQSGLFEKKLKSLTAHIDRLENVNYNQKEEIRDLRKEMEKRGSVFDRMKRNMKKQRGDIQENDIVEALPKLDDKALTRMISQIVNIQQQRRDDKIRNKECAVCFNERKCCAFVPCGHLCVCKDCADVIQRQTSPTCPMCRKPITSHFRVYD